MSPKPEATKVATARLDWLDGMKGISILWIVYFHAFSCLDRPWPFSDGFFEKYRAFYAPSSALDEIGCFVGATFVFVTKLGFHAVPVFLVLSGFGLTYSLAKTGEPAGGWRGWYRSRLLRLFPMYWLAHVIYLVVPFQAKLEKLDYRFVLSFLGDRVWPVDMIMFYFNPALWYFGLLLQLYLVFPVLFRMLRRLGPVVFLAIGTLASVASRRILLMDYVVSGNYVEGGFFLPRSYGFMLGMVFGLLFRKHPERSARWLFSPLVLAFGVACELAGIYSYSPLWRYVFNDVLVSTGFTILIAHAARLAARFPAVGATLAKVGAFSYGLYLVHQPFVLYFAPKLANLAIPDFTVLIASLIVVLTITAMAMERRVNALTQRVLG